MVILTRKPIVEQALVERATRCYAEFGINAAAPPGLRKRVCSSWCRDMRRSAKRTATSLPPRTRGVTMSGMLGTPSFDLDAEAFEELVEDILDEDPAPRRFSARGKDGAIDLNSTRDGVRHVYECKKISKDGVETALRRWHEVAKHLKTHLREPDGPTRGQAQYGPWYRTSPAIRG